MSGVVNRLARVFQNSSDPTVRDAILTKLHHQADKAAAIRFLVDVAKENSPVDSGRLWPAPARAIEILTVMGPDGVTALRQLDANGEVRNSIARRYLQQRKQDSFRPEGTSR